jgi:hypothetical protein
MGQPVCRLSICLFIKHISVFYVSSECKTLGKIDLFLFLSEISVGSHSTPWDSSAILGQERTAFKIQNSGISAFHGIEGRTACQPAG